MTVMDQMIDPAYWARNQKTAPLALVSHATICLVILVVFFLVSHAMGGGWLRTVCQYMCAFSLGWQAALIYLRLRMMGRGV